MILGLGTDLVDVRRIENLLKAHEDRFLEKYFTNLEAQNFQSNKKNKNHILYLAKRFAAKEAFAKALGVGFQDGLYMKDIEIYNNEKGKPFVRCHSGALQKLEEFVHGCKGCRLHLSLTDEPPYAQATVIIEGI